MKKIALSYHEAGLKIIPVSAKKTPYMAWAGYRKEQSKSDVERLFRDKVFNMALLTGGDIEVIDIDSKYALDKVKFCKDLFNEIKMAIGETVFAKLVISKTQSGGYHIFYKCKQIAGNRKLASRYTLEAEKKNDKDNVRVLIETRGNGGYVVVPPSNGYEYIQNTYLNIPEIDVSTRTALMEICKTYEEVESKDLSKKKPAQPTLNFDIERESTIDAFNGSHDCAELLDSLGWTLIYDKGDNNFYRRPDKKDGVSGCYNTQRNIFYCFTTSTLFESERAYTPFQMYCIINDHDSYSSASKELYKLGYGDKFEKTPSKGLETIIDTTTTPDSPSYLDRILNSKFDIKVKPVSRPATLFVQDASIGKYVGIGGDGEMITFLGLQKTRKSAIASACASCFIKGGSNKALRFRASNENRALVHLDTEQGENDYYNTVKGMLKLCGHPVDRNPPNLYSFRLTDYTAKEKVEFFNYVVNVIPDIGCLLLDGIVDLCMDYNDLRETRELVDNVRRMTSVKKFLLINVLHNARSTGKARGHLGTELLNKGKCNINITKDEIANYSTFKIEDLRGAHEPDSFDFTHDANGNLILY